jgi:PTS system nitrogen regulatory IIA component
VQSSGVPAEVLAEFQDGAPGIPLEADSEAGVLQCYSEALGGGGRWRRGLTREQGLAVAEEPRITKGTPADHYSVTPGVLPHADDVGSGHQVTVADDRDLERFDHLGDLIPIGHAGEHLGPGPSVQGERARTGILHPKGNAHRIAGLIVPAAPGLYGDRQVRGTNHGPNDSSHQIHVPQATGAAVALDHLLHRAAEVDIDELGLIVLSDQSRGLSHGIGIRAIDLDTDGTFQFLEFSSLERGANTPADSLGGQKFRQHDIGPHAPANLAEGRLGDAGHWGQHERKRMCGRIGQLHGEKIHGTRVGEQWKIVTSNFDNPGDAELGCRAMYLKDFFSPGAITLNLRGTSKEEILAELVGLLGMDERSSGTLLRIIQRRENLGSTGIGRGIAIPHCRSLVVNRLRLAFGRRNDGVEYQAIDGKPVCYFFLIVAPPLEISNQYLPVLGKIAQFAKETDVPDRLNAIQSAEEFFGLLEEKGV